MERSAVRPLSKVWSRRLRGPGWSRGDGRDRQSGGDMIRVDQTLFKAGGPEDECGNCFAACIASIMEKPLIQIPNFCAHKDWVLRLNTWLAHMGLYYMEFRSEFNHGKEDWGFHIMSGPSPRLKGFYHSVVGFKGEIIHDPHPSRTGLLPCELKEMDWGFIVKSEGW